MFDTRKQSAMNKCSTFAVNTLNNDKANEQNIFLDFVNAINNHNIASLYSLITDDHKFIDAHGYEISGKDEMKLDWTGYFQWFPDYKIELTNILVDKDRIVVVGFAGDTFKGLKTDDNENY